MIKVLDNILPAQEFKNLHDEIMQFDFPWHYGRVAKESETVVNLHQFAFVKPVILDGALIYDPHGIIERSVRMALHYAGEKITSILRVRCIMNTVADNNYDFGYHVDHTVPHRTALIYLNDSDGDTVLYNERYVPSLAMVERDKYITQATPPKLTICETVSPRANRMLIFEGLRYHSGYTPTLVPRRVAININYTTEAEQIPIHTPSTIIDNK